MDTLVIIVKLTDNQFFNIYKNNRKIIGPGYYTLALRAFVTNPDQEPLEKAKAKNKIEKKFFLSIIINYFN